MTLGKLKPFAVLALLAVTAVAGPAASQALNLEIFVQYYGNEEKTNLVGETYRGCDGNGYTWGVRTLYSDRTVTPCP